jgi:hypothetical protein
MWAWQFSKVELANTKSQQCGKIAKWQFGLQDSGLKE